MPTQLTAAVNELLTNRIDSFEKLEVIVALYGAPRSTMSVEELCRALKLSRDVIREAVVGLRGAALVELTNQGQVQLLPPTSRDHAAVVELVTLYNDDRLTLVKAIGENAVARIRNMASHAFADAFVIRKKPPKDGEDG